MDPLAVAMSQLDEMIAKLTPRQLEIVELLAHGHSYRDVCNLLSISRSRVKHIVWHACQRIEVENRTQLIVLYARWKEISLQNERN